MTESNLHCICHNFKVFKSFGNSLYYVLQRFVHLKLFQNEKLKIFFEYEKTEILGFSTFPHLLKMYRFYFAQ